jgi:hypothetical protein
VKLRNGALVLAALLVAVGLYLSLGPPRVLWLNTGLRIEYEWQRGAAALLAAAGAAGMAAVLRQKAGRGLAALAALVLTAFGAQRLAYRVDVMEGALSRRTLLGTTALPWASITRVDATAGELAAAADQGTIRVPTSGLTADERAALERSVSRRVREADPRKDEKAPAR